MAAVTNRSFAAVTTNVLSYPCPATGTFTPVEGELLVVGVGTSGANSAGAEPADESVTCIVGQTTLTFTKVPVQRAYMSDTTRRITFYVADDFCTATPMQVQYAGSGGGLTSFTGCSIQVWGVSGISRVGLDAVRQPSGPGSYQYGWAAIVSSFNVAVNVVMPAAADTGNPVLAAWNNNNAGVVPPLISGFTADGTITGLSTPATTYGYQHRNSGHTSATVVFPAYNSARVMACLELDASATGPVIGLDVAEGADTVSADASVFTPPRLADLAKTEANDSISATAKATAAASLSVTETTDSLAAFAGALPATADLSVQEAHDSVVATAGAVAGASFTKTESNDSVSATVTVEALPGVIANLFIEESPDSVGSDAILTPLPGILASLSVQEAEDSIASTVTYIPATATLTVTEDRDTIAATATNGTFLYPIGDQSFIAPTAGGKATNLPLSLSKPMPNSEIEGVLDTFWGGTGNIENRTAPTFVDSVNPSSYYYGRFSTRPLATQTIPAQNWTYSMAAGEGNLLANQFYWPVLYIWRPSTSAVVKYIFDASGPQGVEWPATVTPAVPQTFAGTSADVQEGDLLVLEAWSAGSVGPGPYGLTWQITSTNSKLISPYKLLYPPHSELYLRALVPAVIPDNVWNASFAPQVNHVNAPNFTTEWSLSESTIHAPVSRGANQVALLNTQQSMYFGRFSTIPLASQVIPAQTWSWELSTAETSDNANTYHWPVLYLWRPGVGVAGYIFNAAGDFGVEWRINDDPRLNQQFAGASVVAQDGDILVAEVWGNARQSGTAGTYAQRLWVDATNSRIVSPYKLAYYSAPTGPVATLTKTEGPDTISATATAAYSAAIANLSVQEATDTIASGATSPIKANVDVPEADDGLSATAKVGATTNLSVQEADNTLSATVSVTAGAAATVQEAGDTLSATGSVIPFGVITASLDVTEAQDRLTSTSGFQGSLGDLSLTEAPDTVLASVTSPIKATLSKQEAPDAIAAAAGGIAGGSLVRQEAADSIASSATSPITGTFNKQELDDAISSIARSVVAGALSVQESPDMILSDASVRTGAFAILTITEAPDLITASGTVADPVSNATLSVQEAGDTSAMYTVHAKKRVILIT